MRRAALPTVKTRFVPPLVILPPENERILHPDKALAERPVDLPDGFPEIAPPGFRAPNIKRDEKSSLTKLKSGSGSGTRIRILAKLVS